MVPAKRDIFVSKATTFDDFDIVWKDTDGEPITISVYTARMQVKKNVYEPAVIEITSEDDDQGSYIYKENVNGLVRPIIVASDMEDIEPGEYVYDLILQNGNEVRRILEGRFIVQASVTDIA